MRRRPAARRRRQRQATASANMAARPVPGEWPADRGEPGQPEQDAPPLPGQRLVHAVVDRRGEPDLGRERRAACCRSIGTISATRRRWRRTCRPSRPTARRTPTRCETTSAGAMARRSRSTTSPSPTTTPASRTTTSSASTSVEEIASYTAPDAHTIQVTLKDAKPQDLGLRHHLDRSRRCPNTSGRAKPWNDPTATREILTPTVVLGPFSVQQFKIDEGATFTPVDTFFAGKPKVPQYQILPSAQPTVAYESLLNGRANWAPNIPPDQYQQAKSQANLTMYEWNAANAQYRDVEFNLTRPFLSDHRVREALARALNRDDIRDVAEQGLATPAYSFIAPANTKWLDPNVEKFDYDLDTSKVAAPAGGLHAPERQPGRQRRPADQVDRLLPDVQRAARQDRHLHAAAVQASSASRSTSAGWTSTPTPTRCRRTRTSTSRSAPGAAGRSTPTRTPRPSSSLAASKTSPAIRTQTVDQLYQQGSTELDETRRKQIYDQVQAQVVQDLPVYFIYSLVSVQPGLEEGPGHRADQGRSALLRQRRAELVGRPVASGAAPRP